MPQKLVFTIPGKPVAKGRPRSYAIFGKDKDFKGVRNVTPEKTRRYESIVREASEAVLEKHALKILSGKVELHVKAFWAWPKSQFRKKNPRQEEHLANNIDADNVLKSVSDAMNNIMYLDDKQVVKASVEKWRANQGDAERVEVTIISLDDEWK